MHKGLEQCIGELRVNHTDKEIAGALSEYFQIVKNVSYDYTDNATVKDIREDHPELGFMDDDEIEGILRQVRIMRDKRTSDAEKRLTREDVVHLCCENGWFDEKEYDGPYARLLEVSKHGIHAQDLISIVWCSSGESLQEIKKQVEGYLHGGREDEEERVMQELIRQLAIWVTSDTMRPLIVRYYNLTKRDI